MKLPQQILGVDPLSFDLFGLRAVPWKETPLASAVLSLTQLALPKQPPTQRLFPHQHILDYERKVATKRMIYI